MVLKSILNVFKIIENSITIMECKALLMRHVTLSVKF
jgi:hypothetical protein